MKVRQPAEAVAKGAARLAGFLQVLMRALQRDDGEARGRVTTSLPHHPSLVAPVAVQRDEERRRAVVRREEVVIEFGLRGERKVCAQVLVRHLHYD